MCWLSRSTSNAAQRMTASLTVVSNRDWSAFDENHLVLVRGWRQAGVELGVHHSEPVAEADRCRRDLEGVMGDHVFDDTAGQVRTEPHS